MSALQQIMKTRELLASKRPMSAVFLSAQKRHFCPEEPKSVDILDINFAILPEIADVLQRRDHFDICMISCHNEGEEAILFNLRNNNYAKLYVAWMWDNHHHHIVNLRTMMLADIVLSSHWHAHQYLNHPLTLCGPHLPLCSRQWSVQQIRNHYPNGLPVSRADGIFGGYGRYKWLAERNAFIEQVMKELPDHALSLVKIEDYFKLPVAERLAGWVNHKVHLVVPVADDLSTRVFEALLTGQIPLVPDNIPDLDRVVSPELQRSLPILRWKYGSIESIRSAWQEAVARFDSDGASGVSRRHAFARDHHSLTARLEAFSSFVRNPVQYGLRSDGRMISWAEPGRDN